MPELPDSDPLAGTASITLVLHGVGDPSAGDICASAKKGLTVAGLDPSAIVDVSVPNFFRFPEANTAVSRRSFSAVTQSALEASIDGKRHLLIPVVWSGMRLRAGRWAAGLGLMGGLQSLMLALPSLGVMCWDVLLCVPRGQSLWKVALAAAFVFLATLIAGFTFAAWWIIVHLSTFIPMSSALYEIAFLAVLISLGWTIQKFSTVLDLPGDVARYVSSDSSRDDAVRNFRELLRVIAKRAPDAEILLMTHSLGSVLASEALSAPPSPAPSRAILLTLGSPLGFMARVFPGQVKTPADLASRFEQHGTVLYWINLWREHDSIGRALYVQRENFLECTLGAGFHADYWSDERLWKAVSIVLLGSPSGGQNFEEAWKLIPLGTTEQAELDSLSRQSILRELSMWLLFLFLFVSARYIYAPPWPEHHGVWTRLVVRVASMLTMGGLSVSWYIAWTANRGSSSGRQLLWEIRTAGSRGWTLLWISGVTGCTAYFIDWVVRTQAL